MPPHHYLVPADGDVYISSRYLASSTLIGDPALAPLPAPSATSRTTNLPAHADNAALITNGATP